MHKPRKLSSLAKVLARNLLLLALLLMVGFALPRLIPGSPLQLSSDALSAENLHLPAATFNRFREYYSPELGLWEQFRRYLVQITRGDWGYSFNLGLPVLDLIKSKLPWTLFLSLSTMGLSTIIGVPLGISMAVRTNNRGQQSKLGILLLLILDTVPAFLLAILVQIVFAYQLRWFPAFGAYPLGMSFDRPGYLWQVARHAVLPLAVLVLTRLPSMAILTRNLVQATLSAPYVEAAYYNGVPTRVVLQHYVLRNCLPEIMARLNIQFIYALAGSVFVEMIFSYPGLGLLMKTAIGTRDYPLVQGVFLISTLFGIAANLLFELWMQRFGEQVAG